MSAGNIEINIDASIVVEQSVSKDVGALNALFVADVMWVDGGVMLLDEVRSRLVGPDGMIPFRVDASTRDDRFGMFTKHRGPALLEVDLVNMTRCQLFFVYICLD